MAFSRILGSNFTNFTEFSSRQNFLNDSVVNFCPPCFFAILPPLFIVLFWSLRGTIDSTVLPPGYQSLCCAHRPEDSVSLFFILSFLLVLFICKFMAVYLFRSTLRSRSSRSSFSSSFFFIVFLKWAESHSASLKVFRCYAHFYTSSFWFPEVPPTCAMRSRSKFFSSFLAGLFDT